MLFLWNYWLIHILFVKFFSIYIFKCSMSWCTWHSLLSISESIKGSFQNISTTMLILDNSNSGWWGYFWTWNNQITMCHLCMICSQFAMIYCYKIILFFYLCIDSVQFAIWWSSFLPFIGYHFLNRSIVIYINVIVFVISIAALLLYFF